MSTFTVGGTDLEVVERLALQHIEEGVQVRANRELVAMIRELRAARAVACAAAHSLAAFSIQQCMAADAALARALTGYRSVVDEERRFMQGTTQ